MKAKQIIVALVIAAHVGAAQGQSQVELNNQAREARLSAEAKLDKVQTSLMAKQPADAKSKLQKALLAWDSFVDRECEFETMKTVGGTIHGMLVAYCEARLTEQRATDFERMLSDCQQESGPSCPLASSRRSSDTAKQELEKADRKLNQVYTDLIKKLRADAKPKLQTAQLSWIRFRDQECDFETTAASRETRPVALASCQARLTGLRAGDLDKMLQECGPEGDLSCPPLAN